MPATSAREKEGDHRVGEAIIATERLMPAESPARGDCAIVGEAIIATERLMPCQENRFTRAFLEVGEAIIATERLMPYLGGFVRFARTGRRCYDGGRGVALVRL